MDAMDPHEVGPVLQGHIWTTYLRPLAVDLLTRVDGLAPRKWLRIRPNPFTDDEEAAGCRHDMSVLHSVLADPMLDTPGAGGSSTSRCRTRSFCTTC